MKSTNHKDLGGYRITNLGAGIASTDAATKGQLDQAILGLKWKEPCLVATTGNISLAGLQTIDGVSVPNGAKVLVKSQTDDKQNGPYIASDDVWARSDDGNSNQKLLGSVFSVMQGTVNKDTAWILLTDTVNLGVSSLIFSQLPGAGGGASYTAGANVDLTGNVISLTGVLRKYSAAIGDGSSMVITVTHNLNTTDVVVSGQEVSSGAGVELDWVANGANTIQITFGSPPTTGQYRVTVGG